MTSLQNRVGIVLITVSLLCLPLSEIFTTTELQSETISTTALTYAKKAWIKLKQKNPNLKPIIMVVDFSRPSNERRAYLVDIRTGRILMQELVAHGSGSGKGLYPNMFSNKNGSLASSLGVFVTGYSYYGSNGYSLRLYGQETGFNSNAFSRAIVVHGSAYVNDARIRKYGSIGNSWGCFALDEMPAHKIIDTLGSNSMIFAYANNSAYLNNSSFLN